LFNAAEAFYYAGVLTSLPFDAMNVEAGNYRRAEPAAEAAAGGRNRRNILGAPPIVNFGFAIELYMKLLLNLASGKPRREHDLFKLFLALGKTDAEVSQRLIVNHPPSRGCREDFVEFLKTDASVFDDWHYAHEKEFLLASSDTLLMLVLACRKTVRELRPDVRSAFGWQG